METIKLKLEKDEKSIINNILVDRIASLASIIPMQESEEKARAVHSMTTACIICQQSFYILSLEEELEIEKSQSDFIRKLLDEVKDIWEHNKLQAIKAGHPSGFEIVSQLEILQNILNKIPAKSLIITP